MEPILSLKNVCSYYDKVQVLYDINVDVYPGEIVSVIGANGAGKSTMMKTIMGLVHMGRGQVTFDGKKLNRMHAHKICKAGIAYVPEGREVFPNMTVLENLEMGAYCRSYTSAQKRSAREVAELGLADVVIGTHALLTEQTRFARLGMVIADEQHRFGVAQRAALCAKGTQPHLLLLSATPIPRTLALIVYGDLDVSVVDELPPGREPVETFLVDERYRARLNAFVRKQAAEGHQSFIVCPAVEDDGGDGGETLKAAEQWAQTLQDYVFPNLRVALLHGKMKGAEKEAVMTSFAAGEADILVATTVIEVGVDVPNATLMVIENADRFGLSQLHQLRGRVGRGSAKAWCVLVSDNKNPETRQRLRTLCGTNDGFRIAEADLQQRGPGDFFGSRQHGLPVFRVGDLATDLAVLRQAQEAAAQLISQDRPLPSPLAQAIESLLAGSADTLN